MPMIQLPFATGYAWEQVRYELSAASIIFSWLPNNQMRERSVNNKSTKQGNLYFGIRKIIIQQLLRKEGGTTLNHRNLNFLAVELFKTIMKNIFVRNERKIITRN